MSALYAAGLMGLFAVAGCSATPGAVDAHDAGCPENAARACECDSGPAGQQVCTVDGTWSACACRGPEPSVLDGAMLDARPDDVPRCLPGLAFCDGACVDPRSNPAHCGRCGGRCTDFRTCVDAECVSAPGPTLCGGEVHDTRSDHDACGNCTHQCGVEEACVDARCVPAACPAPLVRCHAREPCASLDTNRFHCGGCDHACSGSSRCQGGTCVPLACPSPQAACNGTCVSIETDLANCGACGNRCSPVSSCTAGVCHALGCLDGVDCRPTGGDLCVYIDRDPNNCGGCGRYCPPPTRGAAICVSGECQNVCPPDTPTCPGDGEPCSTVIATSNAHCGACGHACTGPTACLDGRCVSTLARPVAPLSGLRVNSHRPRFRWRREGGVDGAQVEVCADRECSRVERTLVVMGDEVRLSDPLAVGVHWWRLRGVRGTAVEVATGPVWEFFVTEADTPVPSAFETVEDYNGDGWPDTASIAAGPSVVLHFGAAAGVAPSPDRVYRPVQASVPYVGGGGVAYYTLTNVDTVSPAGDLNGDGFGDLVFVGSAISGHGVSTSRRFAWYVGYGSALGAPSTVVLTTSPGEMFVHFTPLGDHDGDGYADVGVVESPAAGMLGPTIISGARDETRVVDVSSNLLDFWNPMRVGDFNGDGLSDLALGGSVGFGTSSPLSVRMGGTAPGSGWRPPPTCETEGVSPLLSSVADLDHDGYSDLQTEGTLFMPPPTWHGGPLGLHRDGCPTP